MEFLDLVIVIVLFITIYVAGLLAVYNHLSMNMRKQFKQQQDFLEASVMGIMDNQMAKLVQEISVAKSEPAERSDYSGVFVSTPVEDKNMEMNEEIKYNDEEISSDTDDGIYSGDSQDDCVVSKTNLADEMSLTNKVKSSELRVNYITQEKHIHIHGEVKSLAIGDNNTLTSINGMSLTVPQYYNGQIKEKQIQDKTHRKREKSNARGKPNVKRGREIKVPRQKGSKINKEGIGDIPNCDNEKYSESNDSSRLAYHVKNDQCSNISAECLKEDNKFARVHEANHYEYEMVAEEQINQIQDKFESRDNLNILNTDEGKQSAPMELSEFIDLKSKKFRNSSNGLRRHLSANPKVARENPNLDTFPASYNADMSSSFRRQQHEWF